MELHERLGPAGTDAGRPQHDPFSELKNRVHRGLIEELGKQIFSTAADQTLVTRRITTEIKNRL